MSETGRERLRRAIDSMEKTEVCLEIFDRTFDQAREALQALYDEQNDAPLENRRVQWGYAMTLAREALAAMEAQP